MNQFLKMMVLIVLFVLASFCAIASGEEGEVAFAVISDVRIGAVDPVLGFIASQQVDFIIVPGDFYYDGQDYYPHYQAYGFDVMPETAIDRQKLYLVLGNHDKPPAGDGTFKSQIAPYYPNNGPASSPEGTVFSFDWGNCHLVITNQYWGYSGGGYSQTQLDWITQDLTASGQVFKFVLGHEPAFPLDRHKGNSLDIDAAMRDTFWNIMAEHNAQVYFCGHTHHLSHLVHQGVYQIDAGQVSTHHADVTIVRVNDQEASITSYEASDVKEFEALTQNDPAASVKSFKTMVFPTAGTVSDEINILYEGMPSDGDGGMCFIEVLNANNQNHFGM